MSISSPLKSSRFPLSLWFISTFNDTHIHKRSAFGVLFTFIFLMTQCDCDGMDKPRLNAHLTMPEEALPIVVSLGLMNFWQLLMPRQILSSSLPVSSYYKRKKRTLVQYLVETTGLFFFLILALKSQFVNMNRTVFQLSHYMIGVVAFSTRL